MQAHSSAVGAALAIACEVKARDAHIFLARHITNLLKLLFSLERAVITRWGYCALARARVSTQSITLMCRAISWGHAPPPAT